MKKDLDELHEEISRAREILTEGFSYETKTTEELRDYMRQHGISFVDPHFPPNNRSIYE